jgi:hypothetical protein
MYVSEKYIRVLLSKPLKWFCVLPALLVSVVLFAHNDRPFIPHKIKPSPLIKSPPLIKPMPVDRLSKSGTGLLFNPADIVINQCGNAPITLPTAADANFNNPTIIANYPNGPTWSDGSTGNSLNVTSSGTYYWQRTAANSVVNGDFESGNTGFQHAGYTDVTTNTPSTSLLQPAGTYAVGKNPNLYHNNFFAPNGDHTSGQGNMMIVNGSDTPNKIVWQESITVKPSTDYVFSFWAANISQADITNNNTSILQFSLNNGTTTTALGTITLSTSNALGVWQYFNTIWNSGSISGTVTIALINNNTNTAGGNDFAVDDILFAEIYRQQYNITMNPIPVLSVIREICGVPSYDLTQTIVGYDLSTYTYTFKDGSGNILSGTQITSAPVGTYTITETNKATGCTSNPQNTTVSINPVPTLSVTSPPTQCAPYDLKNAINGYDATTYTYTYQNGATTLGSSIVSTSGTYTITATNKVTGCVSTSQNVTVTINLLANLTVTSPTVTCVANASASSLTYDLYNTITSSKTGYTYIYEDMAGNVLGTGTNFIVTENANNTYQIIEQNASGCQSAPKTVTITFSNPFLSVISPVTVCGSSSYNLQSAITNFDPGTYAYTYRNGANTSNLPSQTVTASGTYTIRAANSAGCRTIATVTVNFVTPPTLTVTSPPAQCGGTYDLKNAITNYDNTVTYTYSSGASSVVATSGTYTITATKNGCSSSATVTVTINPIPVLTVTSPPAQCGGSFDLSSAINSPDPTVTYTYSSGASSVVSTSGTYTITATKNGCSTSATVTVTINPIPVLSVTSPPAQCGGSFDLHSAINSPDPTVTYTYSSGASSVVSTSGTYTITATKNGCSSSATVNVTINPIPVLTVTSPPAQCGGSFDLSSAINSPDPTVTYTYSSGASSVVSTSGTYTITATKNGCSTSATVTVTINPIPVLSVTSPPAQCGGSFDLHSAINSPDPTVTYTYSSGASSVVSTSGTYTITATKNGCSSSATVNVTINPIPLLTVTSPPAQCGGSFDLHSAINSPDATVTYSYSSGTSSVSTSGAYTITATKNGCSTTATVNVTINPIPVLVLNGPHTECVTYDLTQTIVGGYDPTTYTYVFKDPLGNVITLANAQAITQSGTYTITEQNKSTGCTSLPQSTTVTISPNPPKPGIISTPY